MGIISSIFGGKKSAAQEVRLVGEEGFVDLDLPLASHTTGNSGSTTLVARGVFENVSVGFSVEIHSTWKAKPVEDGSATFYWGRATLKSIGPVSDNFLRMLARLYDLSVPHEGMLPVIEVEAVALDSDPKHIGTAPVRMKLFFNPQSNDRYAEVFLNTDVPEQLIQFHEKDVEYRPQLIRALHEVA